MSEIRAAKAGDQKAFPGSTFVVKDTPPIAQCQEAQITGSEISIVQGQTTVLLPNAFVGFDLTGKKVTILFSPMDDGTYNILSNTDSVLTTDRTWLQSDDFSELEVHDAGQAYLTRNQSSFTRFIENENQAHTTKGGQLFTDTPNPPMNNACSDTFAPL